MLIATGKVKLDSPVACTLTDCNGAPPGAPFYLDWMKGWSGDSNWKKGGADQAGHFPQPEELGHREGIWESRHNWDMAPED